MDERMTKISELLQEAGETNHVVYRITDGTDADWASWYSDWLTKLSELPDLLDGEVVRSELTYLLVKLDKDHQEQASSERWQDFYSRGLVEHFSRLTT
jgi:hypothetical protein